MEEIALVTGLSSQVVSQDGGTILLYLHITYMDRGRDSTGDGLSKPGIYA